MGGARVCGALGWEVRRGPCGRLGGGREEYWWNSKRQHCGEEDLDISC